MLIYWTVNKLKQIAEALTSPVGNWTEKLLKCWAQQTALEPDDLLRRRCTRSGYLWKQSKEMWADRNMIYFQHTQACTHVWCLYMSISLILFENCLVFFKFITGCIATDQEFLKKTCDLTLWPWCEVFLFSLRGSPVIRQYFEFRKAFRLICIIYKNDHTMTIHMCYRKRRNFPSLFHFDPSITTIHRLASALSKLLTLASYVPPCRIPTKTASCLTIVKEKPAKSWERRTKCLLVNFIKNSVKIPVSSLPNADHRTDKTPTVETVRPSQVLTPYTEA